MNNTTQQKNTKSSKPAYSGSSREIKYRAWDKVNKEFVSFEGINFIDNLLIITFARYGDPEFSYSLDNYILLQYTGLKDKNGTEIYKGDILKITEEYLDVYINDMKLCGELGIVKWIEMGAEYWFDVVHDKRFNAQYSTKHKCYLWGGLDFLKLGTDIFAQAEDEIEVEHCEVIGNIYQNKNLLR